MKIVVIIPTYNERENIGSLIEAIQEVFAKIRGHNLGILVVDDNSPDGTGGVVREKMKKYKNVSLLTNPKKMGLGGAYLAGMNEAFNKKGADVVFEFDADFSHDPKKIPEFVAKIEQRYDMVLGSRYIPGGSIPDNWGIHRKFLSVFGNLFISSVMLDFSIRDWTTGYRAIKKWVYEKVREKITEFTTYTFQISFLFHALRAGAKIAEVPIHFVDRTRGKSKMPAIEYITRTLFFVIKSRFFELLGGRFFKFAVVGFIGYLVNAAGLEIFFRLGFQPGIAAAIGAEFAIISNFTLNNIWTFREVKISEPLRILWKFLQFNLTSAGAIIIQAVVVGVGTFLFGNELRQILLVVAIVFFVIPYNYTMYNVFIWRTWKIPALSWLQKKIG